jgi:hypothetical protein
MKIRGQIQTEVLNDALNILKPRCDCLEIDGQPFSLARKANQTILTAEAYATTKAISKKEKFGSSVRRRMLEGCF